MPQFDDAKSRWSLSGGDKLGLALSGGGFRASLFHIGALARMAELDLLRHVQILSTVSGGSIVGAFYYLKVKQLLEGQRLDAAGRAVEPSPQAYVDIVKEMEVEFLAAVQTNIRAQTLCNAKKNGKMAVSDDYSRSDRISEVYHQRFYAPLWKDATTDSRILLKDMKIAPKGEIVADVERYNAEADYKIPILVLNATSLNTGHAWRFTTSYVGEFRRLQPTLDATATLDCLRFDGKHLARPLPDYLEKKRLDKLHDLTLSDAVAASACVPGIFAPFALHDLYWSSEKKEIVVELVDGGLFDNQGIDALLEPATGRKCTHVLCSDASGQIEDRRTPSTHAVSVLGRTNEILMARVRDQIYRELNASALKDFVFLHLRETAAERPHYPSLPGPGDRPDASGENGHVYRLSALRTDLDSFTDLEAHALMYHAYCLIDGKLAEDESRLGAHAPGDWRFLNIREEIAERKARLADHLDLGREKFFKPLRLMDPIAIAVALASVTVAVAIGYFAWGHLELVIALVASIAFGVWLARMVEDLPSVKKISDRIRVWRRGDPWYLTTLPAAAFGWIGSVVAFVQLRILDPRFLKSGKYE